MSAKLTYLCTLVLVLIAVPLVNHGQAQNLVQNPGFEQDEAILDDPDWAGWVTWNPAEGAGSNATIVDTEFVDGARSLMIEPRGGTDWYFIVLHADIPLEVGTEHTTSFWAKAAAPRPFGVGLKAMDNSVSWGGAAFDLTTEWAEYSVSSLAENALAKLEFYCAATDDTVWLDLVSVEEEVVLPPSLLVNGSFEDDEVIQDDPDWAGWVTWNPAEGSGTVTFDQTEVIDGAWSVKIEPRGGTDWFFILLHSDIPLEVDREYTISFWAKAAAPRPFGLGLKAMDNSITWSGAAFDLTTEWAEYSVSGPAMNALAKLEFYCAATDDTIWLDNVSLYAEGDEPVRLVANGSFEEDEPVLDDPDWEAWATWNPAEGAGSNATIVDTEAIDGARSLRVEPIGPENWHFIVLNSPIMVDMDKNYTVSFWAKAAAPRPLTFY